MIDLKIDTMRSTTPTLKHLLVLFAFALSLIVLAFTQVYADSEPQETKYKASKNFIAKPGDSLQSVSVSFVSYI